MIRSGNPAGLSTPLVGAAFFESRVPPRRYLPATPLHSVGLHSQKPAGIQVYVKRDQVSHAHCRLPLENYKEVDIRPVNLQELREKESLVFRDTLAKTLELLHRSGIDAQSMPRSK